LRNIIQRAAPLSEVRSSTQSTTATAPLCAWSAGVAVPLPVPGRGGGVFRGAGSGGAGSFGKVVKRGWRQR